MDLESTYSFDAPLQAVWDLLMDTTAIGACLPGCRGLRPAGEDRYDVELAVAVAAVAGDFKGTVALEDKRPPHEYSLLIDGSGRQGFVKGRARIRLETEGTRTLAHITAHADVGGTMARVGQRLLAGVAKATMDRFYACLASRAASPAEPGAPGDAS
jgi:carbon monoxide dehydrogenase subunit G